jgi:N6-L-threonylcarbamoyladenine synthase
VRVLGIETSCDETAAAVVEGGEHILSSTVASQVEFHARYGGIVPEVASRQHILAILPVVERALGEAGVGLERVEAIAVTNGPGLPGSLLVGVSLAKALALAKGLPLVGVNHLEAHLYSLWLAGPPPPFPALALLVSGGHTELVLMKGHGDIWPLGRTRDDAAGEALDKAARLLGLGYPGGPAIEKVARQGEARFPLPRAWLKGSYDFSFSGLKTALRRMVEEMAGPLPIADLAASFQQAVVDMLVAKALEVAGSLPVKAVLVAGGVAANTLLRETLLARSPLPLLIPPSYLCTDNAAMVAACGYFRLGRGERAPRDMDIAPSLPWG